MIGRKTLNILLIRYCEGTGSVIQAAGTREDLDRVFRDLQDSGDVGVLGELGLRYFSPGEIAVLLGFPAQFSFPSTVTLKQQYKVLGNSLNVSMVGLLIVSLMS